MHVLRAWRTTKGNAFCCHGYQTGALTHLCWLPVSSTCLVSPYQLCSVCLVSRCGCLDYAYCQRALCCAGGCHQQGDAVAPSSCWGPGGNHAAHLPGVRAPATAAGTVIPLPHTRVYLGLYCFSHSVDLVAPSFSPPYSRCFCLHSAGIVYFLLCVLLILISRVLSIVSHSAVYHSAVLLQGVAPQCLCRNRVYATTSPRQPPARRGGIDSPASIAMFCGCFSVRLESPALSGRSPRCPPRGAQAAQACNCCTC